MATEEWPAEQVRAHMESVVPGLKHWKYRNDFSDGRLHHEIYMSDARKVAPEKWMTVIRHPICKKEV